jgi:O-acetyl-ADP-ribose deacetylase (regulator of RNase III)
MGFPPEHAAKIAICEVHEHAQGVEVVFVCFDSETHPLYNRLLASYGNESQCIMRERPCLKVGKLGKG